MADLFDGIATWLIEQALASADLSETVAGLANRLIDGGMPISRINTGRVLMHPIIGLANLMWDIDSGKVTWTNYPRRAVNASMLDSNPFSRLSLGNTEMLSSRLSDPGEADRFPIFRDLLDDGHIGYAGYFRRFGDRQTIFKDISEDFRGANVSFCTRRFSGFSQSELDDLDRLITPLCVCLRMATERFLASELLETYLGRISGKRVLSGHSARGSGERINCVLLYSDMRASVELSRNQSTEAYLDTLNDYFDCTAGAVLDHGGEVLKFIGDGVLAIFPVDDTTRPPANMCTAALSAAREAFARAGHRNAQRAQSDLPAISFGIGLHRGEVLYGNVGTARRLDFTATGAAVALVSRCEALTRDLDVPLIATQDFSDTCPEPGTRLARQPVRGFSDDVGLFAYQPRSA